MAITRQFEDPTHNKPDEEEENDEIIEKRRPLTMREPTPKPVLHMQPTYVHEPIISVPEHHLHEPATDQFLTSYSQPIAEQAPIVFTDPVREVINEPSMPTSTLMHILICLSYLNKD